MILIQKKASYLVVLCVYTYFLGMFCNTVLGKKINSIFLSRCTAKGLEQLFHVDFSCHGCANTHYITLKAVKSHTEIDTTYITGKSITSRKK